MPFVAAKCQKCGYNMQVDESLERGFCPACGTPYVKEDVVNNYNTYNTNIYQIEHADVVISDSSSVEKRLENAEVFLTVHYDFRKAAKIYGSVTEDAPADYRGWWGLVRADTFLFSHERYYEHRLRYGDKSKTETLTRIIDIDDQIVNYFSRAINVAPRNERSKIKKEWDIFCKKYIAYAQGKLNDFKDNKQIEVNNLQLQSKQIKKRIDELETELKMLDNEINDLLKLSKKDDKIAGVILAIFAASGVFGFFFPPLWYVTLFTFLLILLFIPIDYCYERILNIKIKRKKVMREKIMSDTQPERVKLQSKYNALQEQIEKTMKQ